jgi:hypothetical protein
VIRYQILRPGSVGLPAQILPVADVRSGVNECCDFEICGVRAFHELRCATGSLYSCRGHHAQLVVLRERLLVPRVDQALILRRYRPRLKRVAVARVVGS